MASGLSITPGGEQNKRTKNVKHCIMAKQNEYRDKVVVITGASGGVGRVTAWEFGKQGAKVVLLARDRAQLEATKQEVESHGGQAHYIITDVADADQVEAAAEEAERVFGPIDVWINSAVIVPYTVPR